MNRGGLYNGPQGKLYGDGTQQTQVDDMAREYTRLVQERNERMQKAIMVAIMELSLGQYQRAQQTLMQALNS